jgi:tetratricopeptide (TPR) repeat protein
MKTFGRWSWWVVVVCFLASFDARAATPKEAALAEWQKGSVEYALGHYAVAATHYEAAYRLVEDPTLLFNLAQSHRLAGDIDEALATYRSFLRKAPASSPERESARKKIVELEAIVATRAASPGAPSSSVAAKSISPEPALSPAIEPQAQAEQSDARHTRRALEIVAVGTGAAGVIVGSVFGLLARSEWNQAKASCGGEPSHCSDAPSAIPHQSRASKDADVATGAFVVGGALLATGAVLYLTGGIHETSNAPGLTVLPTLAPGLAGVSLARRFW